MKNNGFDSLGQLGRAEFVGAVVADKKMLYQQGQFRGKFRDRGDLSIDQLDFHHEMAQKLACIGVFHGPVERKFIDFADVMQKAAHQQKIDVDTAIIFDDFQNELEQRQGVFQQAAYIRMVDRLSAGSPSQ